MVSVVPHRRLSAENPERVEAEGARVEERPVDDLERQAVDEVNGVHGHIAICALVRVVSAASGDLEV